MNKKFSFVAFRELFRDEFYEPDYDPKTLFDTKTRKLKNNEFTRLKVIRILDLVVCGS